MSFNEWIDKFYELSKNDWKGNVGSAEVIARLHLRLSNALSESQMFREISYHDGTPSGYYVNPGFDGAGRPLKPIGEAFELVNCVVLIMQYMGHRGWNMDKLISEQYKYMEKTDRG